MIGESLIVKPSFMRDTL